MQGTAYSSTFGISNCPRVFFVMNSTLRVFWHICKIPISITALLTWRLHSNKPNLRHVTRVSRTITYSLRKQQPFRDATTQGSLRNYVTQKYHTDDVVRAKVLLLIGLAGRQICFNRSEVDCSQSSIFP